MEERSNVYHLKSNECANSARFSDTIRNGTENYPISVCITCYRSILNQECQVDEYCTGCNQYLKYDVFRRWDRHPETCNRRKKSKGKTKRNGKESSSNEDDGDENEDDPEGKSDGKHRTKNKKRAIGFELEDYEGYFGCEYYKVQFGESREMIITFGKKNVTCFAPHFTAKGYPRIDFVEVFPNNFKATANSENIRGEMKNDKPIIRFKSVGWNKPFNHDFAKVNMHLWVKRNGVEESIVSFLGSEQFSVDEHSDIDKQTSDTMCLSIDMKGAAENVDTVDGNFDGDSHSLPEPLTDTRGNIPMEATVDTTDYVPFNDRENHEEWFSEIIRRCDKNVFGYSPIEYCIAMNDHDGLKYVIHSNRFDLNKKDNFGYSKEFWCYYYQNSKALHVIQSRKKLEMDIQPEEGAEIMDDLEQSFDSLNIQRFELGTSPSNSIFLIDADTSLESENASDITFGPYLTIVSLNDSLFNNCQYLKMDGVKLRGTSSEHVWKTIGRNASQLKSLSIHLSGASSVLLEHSLTLNQVLTHCKTVERIMIKTSNGNECLSDLINQYDHRSSNLKSLNLTIDICNEQVYQEFMVLFGNVCNVVAKVIQFVPDQGGTVTDDRGNDTETTAAPTGILVLGNTGTGKSFLANILLGRNHFVHEESVTSVTTTTDFTTWQESFHIFDIPGMVESDERNIERNKKEIERAFQICPNSRIMFVCTGAVGGRLRSQDVVAYKVLSRAYQFNPRSVVFVINKLAKKTASDAKYRTCAIDLLRKVLELPDSITEQQFVFVPNIDEDNIDNYGSEEHKTIFSTIDLALNDYTEPTVHKRIQEIQLQVM